MVDEHDDEGYESQAESFGDPVTERVRIIGAEPVGSAPGPSAGGPASSPPPGAAAYPDDASDPITAVTGHSRTTGLERDEASPLLGSEPSRPAWLDVGESFGDDDAPVSAELPHWSDPPTGQVPAVLERGDPESRSQATDVGPAWREHRHEWDDSGFDPSLLADETTRVGALEESPLEERQPWEFDDLGTPPTGTTVTTASDDDGGRRVDTGREPPPLTDTEAPPEEPPPIRLGAAASPAMPSISSSPLRAGAEAPPAGYAPTRGARRDPTAAPHGGSGRNVPVSIATGLVIAAVAVACFKLGSVATLVLATVVVTMAAAEAYAAMRRAGGHPATLLGLVATAAIMVAAYAKGVAALPLVFVLLVVTSMVWYLVGAERGSPVAGISSTVLGFAWVGVLGSFGALILAPSQYPQGHGVAFLFGAVVATVGADVGALVIGAWRGRHPLAPTVSPNKTWEGLIGGTVFAILASAAITGLVHPWTPAKAAVLGLVAAVVAPVGDLCESLIKRDLGLKDMGSLLPGHGGILDRVDALLFVLPATYYLVRVLHLG